MGGISAMKPWITAAIMGLMMLIMMHRIMTGNSWLGGPALALFVGAHLAVLAGLIGVGYFAARLSPGLRWRPVRLHRPAPSHLAAMLSGAATAAFAVHVSIHGGL